MGKMKEFFSAPKDNGTPGFSVCRTSAATAVSCLSAPFTMLSTFTFASPESFLPIAGLACAAPIFFLSISGAKNVTEDACAMAAFLLIFTGPPLALMETLSGKMATGIERNIEYLNLPPSLDLRPQIVPKPKVLELQSQGEINYTIETVKELTCQPGAVCNVTIGKPGAPIR